ncbi:MAG: hypothetical protein A4E53_03393 [Pelotomaculum sp. PtaB.Bin104]|nr:MAG: hypothetical protein A4E53_03393 [Pelotomaculum sp. PtaB.Bin104]
MNNKALTLVKQERFGELECDFYKKDDEYYMTREQIGRALDYSDPAIAIYKIHERNKDRLDKFSVLTKLVSTDGKIYEVYLYSRKGVYEICRWSRQPKADAFFDWVYDVLEKLAKGELLKPQYKNERIQAAMEVFRATDVNSLKTTDRAEMFRMVKTALKQSIRSVEEIPTAIEKLTNEPENNFEVQLVTALVELIENESLARIYHTEPFWPCDALKELITKHTKQDMSYQQIISVLNNIDVMKDSHRFKLKSNGKEAKKMYYSLRIGVIKRLANRHGIGVTHIDIDRTTAKVYQLSK